MGGPSALGWADMAHWSALTSATVRSAEWRVLRSMDIAYLDACREAAERDRISGSNPHTISEQPMTADVFDAIFQ